MKFGDGKRFFYLGTKAANLGTFLVKFRDKIICCEWVIPCGRLGAAGVREVFQALCCAVWFPSLTRDKFFVPVEMSKL